MNSEYTVWVLHGENQSATLENDGDDGVEIPETYEMFRDAYNFDGEDNAHTEPTSGNREDEFKQALEYAETPLYHGCSTFTIMSAIVTLYKHKTAHNLSDTGYDELLDIIRVMIPSDNSLPKGIYETNKLLKKFDLGYEKIHACANDCCLFRKENKDLNACPKCGTSRWKTNAQSKVVREGVPAKVLWYFPIVPRFRRFFRSKEKAEQILWHSTHKSEDKKMRHPVDSLAWDMINKKWPCFASDPRNLRLGLAADGFNPFGDLSRPKQPGNDIDVFLEPLIEDLKELWEKGVEIYDSLTKSMFNLKVVLMWTINDLPAYSNLAGQATKGKCGCLVCANDTSSQQLPCSQKTVYRDYRRFLPYNYPFRKKRAWFNGKEEFKLPPRILSGSEIFYRVKNFKNNWGKSPKSQEKSSNKRKRSQRKPPQEKEKSQEGKDPFWPWKKKSIFFELPYWEVLPIRHNLDVMHIEKNVCESILGTLLNIKGKSKDELKARMDLVEMGIRCDLHPKEKGNKYHLPPAIHILMKEEKVKFCKRLKQLKLPDGYSSNIGQRVALDECKITGLKSHDCHVLMQQLLPVALRGSLPKGPRNAIFRLCSFFNTICQRVIVRKQLEKLENEIVETLCMFERFFPPSFFDMMVHVTIHLAREAIFCGPVQFRWMYPFERKHLAELKNSDGRLARYEHLLQNRHMETFSSWLKAVIPTMCNVSSMLRWLARGPREEVISYTGYIVNGQRFHTKDVERSTQNSGVTIEAETICRSSARDTNQVVQKISYYGVLKEIILLDYRTFKVLLFHCDWANIRNGIKVEEGLTLVNLQEGQSQFARDPFILASQAK
ncbi:uncharacterized protein LOC132280982 [Cornus florida]|uniref:uncharacterized protein LOC132280982 n=1 Tax=Cornus florida TaxID=4283 RepID=UPI00289EEB9A|nr:uncharacterized protein LOC132280982 [Cornus florida]